MNAILLKIPLDEEAQIFKTSFAITQFSHVLSVIKCALYSAYRRTMNQAVNVTVSARGCQALEKCANEVHLERPQINASLSLHDSRACDTHFCHPSLAPQTRYMTINLSRRTTTTAAFTSPCLWSSVVYCYFYFCFHRANENRAASLARLLFYSLSLLSVCVQCFILLTLLPRMRMFNFIVKRLQR